MNEDDARIAEIQQRNSEDHTYEWLGRYYSSDADWLLARLTAQAEELAAVREYGGSDLTDWEDEHRKHAQTKRQLREAEATVARLEQEQADLTRQLADALDLARACFAARSPKETT